MIRFQTFCSRCNTIPNKTIHSSGLHGDKIMLQDIINKNTHESEIQKYLQENSEILINSFGNPEIVVYPKFKLGSEYECDFILYNWCSSVCSKTTVVELKLPRAKLLTKSNIPTKDLSLALSQVNKYMNWIHKNQIYFHNQLYNISKPITVFDRIREFINHKPNYINSVIIIGQRAQFSEEENLYRSNIYQTTHGGIEIVSYDRLIESENKMQKFNQ